MRNPWDSGDAPLLRRLGRVPASPVPRRHQYYEGAATSRSRTPGSLWIRFQAPRVPPLVRARRSAPGERGGRSAGRVRFKAMRSKFGLD